MFLHIEKIPENVRLFIEGTWLIVTALLNLFLLLFGGIVFYSDKKIGVFSLIATAFAIIIYIVSLAVIKKWLWPYIPWWFSDIEENVPFTRWLLALSIFNAIVALRTPSGMPSENLEMIHHIAQALSLVSCSMIRCQLYRIYHVYDEMPGTEEFIIANILSLLFILSFATLLIIHFGNGML